MILNDTWTDADGTSPAAHVGELCAAWTKIFGTGSALISSNRLRQGSGNSYWRSSAIPSSADYSVSAVLHYKSAVAGLAGVIGRMTHAAGAFDPDYGNGYYAMWSGYLTGWTLYKRINGTYTQLGSTSSATLTANTDYTIELVMSGTSIEVFVDGVSKISVTDSTITAAGGIGVIMDGTGSASTGMHMDQVYAELGSEERVTSKHVSFVVDGDSISSDYARLGTATIDQLLGAPSRWNSGVFWNFAVPSQTVVAALADGVAQVDPCYALTAGHGQRLCVVMIGVNDVVSAATASDIYTNIRDYHAARRSTGFRTVGMTILEASTVSGANETKRAAVNSNLTGDTSFCDYFLDAAAIAEFGDPTDTTYFVDGVHLTAAGAAILANNIITKVPIWGRSSMFF